MYEFVEKLSADGAGVAWKAPIGNSLTGTGIPLAVDSTGRAFAAVVDQTTLDARFVRVNATGVVDYTTDLNVTLGALPGAIAVDSTGTEVVVGVLLRHSLSLGLGDLSLAWLTPDANAKSYSTVPQAMNVASLTLAVAPGGDAIVSSTVLSGGFSGQILARQTVLLRIQKTGAVRFSETVQNGVQLAVDAAGNVYMTGDSGGFVHPVKNSLAICGTAWLSVIAPDGTILQTTYIAGSSGGPALVATAAGSAFLLAAADPTVPPTQAGPFVTDYLANPSNAAKLFRLSPNSTAQTFPLVCIGSGATYNTGPIAPGEIVTLFGNGLGPLQGMQTTATLTNPFPTQAGNVEVTFDGRCAYLGAGLADQCRCPLVGSAAQHAGLCLLQQREDELPDLACDTDCSGCGHGGRHVRGSAERGWLDQFCRQPGKIRLRRLDICYRSGPDQPFPGRRHTGGNAVAYEPIAAPTGDHVLRFAMCRADPGCDLCWSSSLPDCRGQPDQFSGYGVHSVPNGRGGAAGSSQQQLPDIRRSVKA